jgi:ATP-dependent HslUV protease ATP-binding subunit HslU
VFIDEIDKVVSPSGTFHRTGDPSTEGVQRDLLPLIEGKLCGRGPGV